MKKTLLTLCLCAAGAMSANAQGTVYAEEKFDWLQPFSETFALGDPVGTDNAETKGIDFEPSNPNKIDGKNPMNIFWDDLGYRTRIWPQSACYEIFAHKNYLRLGGNEARDYGIQTAGMRWFGTIGHLDIPEYPDALYLSFDWCPYKDAEGNYDEISLMLETRPGNIANNALITHDLKAGEPMRWIHVEIDLYDTVGEVDPALSSASNFMIQPIAEYQNGGKHRYYLDNLMLHTESVGDQNGVGNISVDNNATVEYYNLQGVRVANPESGLYIRKKGNQTSKILFR